MWFYKSFKAMCCILMQKIPSKPCCGTFLFFLQLYFSNNFTSLYCSANVLLWGFFLFTTYLNYILGNHGLFEGKYGCHPGLTLIVDQFQP